MAKIIWHYVAGDGYPKPGRLVLLICGDDQLFITHQDKSMATGFYGVSAPNSWSSKKYPSLWSYVRVGDWHDYAPPAAVPKGGVLVLVHCGDGKEFVTQRIEHRATGFDIQAPPSWSSSAYVEKWAHIFYDEE